MDGSIRLHSFIHAVGDCKYFWITRPDTALSLSLFLSCGPHSLQWNTNSSDVDYEKTRPVRTETSESFRVHWTLQVPRPHHWPTWVVFFIYLFIFVVATHVNLMSVCVCVCWPALGRYSVSDPCVCTFRFKLNSIYRVTVLVLTSTD